MLLVRARAGPTGSDPRVRVKGVFVGLEETVGRRRPIALRRVS